MFVDGWNETAHEVGNNRMGMWGRARSRRFYIRSRKWKISNSEFWLPSLQRCICCLTLSITPAKKQCSQMKSCYTLSACFPCAMRPYMLERKPHDPHTYTPVQYQPLPINPPYSPSLISSSFPVRPISPPDSKRKCEHAGPMLGDSTEAQRLAYVQNDAPEPDHGPLFSPGGLLRYTFLLYEERMQTRCRHAHRCLPSTTRSKPCTPPVRSRTRRLLRELLRRRIRAT